MSIEWVSTYQPVWEDRGRRVAGPDEDLLTMAVSAGVSGMQDFPETSVERVIVVVAEPDIINSAGSGVIRRALGISRPVPVETRLGGAPVALEAIAAAAPGTVVIGVESGSKGAASGAVLVGTRGTAVEAAGMVDRSLPMRVRELGGERARAYNDSRLEREGGWRKGITALAPDSGDVFVAGAAGKDAGRLGARAAGEVHIDGPAAPFFALRDLIRDGSAGRLIAVDAGNAQAVDVQPAPGTRLVSNTRPAVARSLAPRFAADHTEIPIAMPAYDRALDAKIGMVGARCQCGELSFPPRSLCLACGELDATAEVVLPRTGTVYSVVTIHIKVPSMATPYARAVVSLEGVPLRVLAAVTDVPPIECAIGDGGTLVLRRVAIRDGVPDYGYSFQPATVGGGIS